MGDEAKVRLVASNGETIEMSRRACDRVNTIKGMVEDLGLDDSIPLQISEPILREVVEYAEYRALNPIDSKFLERKPGPMDSYDMTRFSDVANTEFTRGLSVENPRGYVEDGGPGVDPLGKNRPVHYPLNLNSLLITANYLDFPELLMAVSRTIALRLRDKSVAVIREEWDILNDLTKEEEDKIRAENEWFDEKEMPEIPTIEEIKRQVAATQVDLSRYEAQRAELIAKKKT